MKVGRLLLRTAVGGFFVGHGTQKLFGSFGGNGLSATAAGFESMGLRPGKVHATAAGIAETAGGAGLALGYQTPLASAAIVSVMLTAINRVHLKNGPWAHKGGYEYNVVLLAAAVALAESGPGALSLDALRGKQREGAKWGLLALVLGTAGAAGAHFFAEQQAAGAAPAAADSNGASAAVEPPAAEPTPAPAKANGKNKTASAAKDAAADEPVADEPEANGAVEAE
jgi:putative oxidoreductase